MAFLTEPEPPRGRPMEVVPGISRIVANNPSLMTYRGTNTYLIEDGDGFVVLDPGPDDAGHLDDILRATGGAVSAIVLSHPFRPSRRDRRPEGPHRREDIRLPSQRR